MNCPHSSARPVAQHFQAGRDRNWNRVPPASLH